MRRFHLGKTVILFLAAAFPVLLIAASAWASGPTGASPNDPLMVPTGDQTIAPNATLWFYFDYAVDTSGPGGFGGRGAPRGRTRTGSLVDVTVDAGGVGGLQMGIYTPAQGNDWLNDPTTTPIGRGTPYVDPTYDKITHDLHWAGAFNTSGRYLIAITNGSATPATFTMTVTGESVTLYPIPTLTPTPTLPVPFTVTPAPVGTTSGKIVFETATGGDIYTVNGDGSNLTKVSHGIDPAWSPDGKQITLARWDNVAPGLYIANADGSGERQLLASPRVRWPRWSPDGKYIVFSQDKTKSENNVTWKLSLVEVATSKLSEPQCSQLCFVPSWNKDSTTLIYTDPGIGILTTNAFQGPATRLGPNATYWDSGANIPRPMLNWPPMQDSEMSPDGTRIVYSMQAHDRWELNMMNADGTGQTGITTPDPIQYYLLDIAVHNVAPTWSTDGQQIMFLSDRNGKWEFFVADPSGSNIKQVLKNVTDQVTIQFGYNNERIMDWTN